VVELLNGDVTSGPRRPLAAEIDKPPLMTRDETQITCVLSLILIDSIDFGAM
jgi:hypothetical protein